jgi:uncharacterized protein (DUF1330 family)
MTDRMTTLESAATLPAYFVALVEIHDPAGFQLYHEQFEATLAPFGGRLASFGATIVPLEGMDASTARAAIVVFPSLQAGRNWFESPAYRKIHRSANDPHGPAAFSSKDSQCRSNERSGSDPLVTCPVTNFDLRPSKLDVPGKKHIGKDVVCADQQAPLVGWRGVYV